MTLIDINPARAELARQLDVSFSKPDSAKGDSDVVFHASGSAAGLETAISLAGDEATVLELSWYGDTPVAMSLGGAFHSRRLQLISSQVGKVAQSHRPRWTHRRRLAAALALLADSRFDAFLRRPCRFAICRSGCRSIPTRQWRRRPAHIVRLGGSFVFRRSPRPHYDCPLVPRRYVRSGAGAAWGDLRHRRSIFCR